MKLSDALDHAARFKIARTILETVINAKRCLGLDCDTDRRELARLRYEGPTTVTLARISGAKRIHDGTCWPNASYEDRFTDFPLDACTLDQAKGAITMSFLDQAWETGTIEHSLDKLTFFDHLGNVVAEAAIEQVADGEDDEPRSALVWQTAAAYTDAEIADKEQRAISWYREAQELRGIGHADTANAIKRSADRLLRDVAITLNCMRLAA